MPSETRKIVFSNNELITAINRHNQVSKNKLPKGMITTCKPLSQPGVAVRLEMLDQESGESTTVDLSPEVIGAALVRYCIAHKIPIPRHATKSVTAEGDDIALTLQVGGGEVVEKR